MLHRERSPRLCPARRANQRRIKYFRVPSLLTECSLPFELIKRIPKRTCEMSSVPYLEPPTEGIRPMPRYFFNTRIGDQLISDPEGEDLRNPDRAWEVARAMIRELLRTEGAEAGLFNAILEVTDDEGEIVLEFPFAEAMLDFSDTPVTRH